MKKHISILIVVALAALFMVVLTFNEQKTNNLNKELVNPGGSGSLPTRISALGKSAIDELEYNKIKSDIGAYSMAGEITAEDTIHLLTSLEHSRTKALVITFDDLLTNACGKNDHAFHDLAYKLQQQQPVSSSPELVDRLQIYQNFQNFFSCETRVNGFLSQRYDGRKATSLKNEIQSIANSKGVVSCDVLQGRKKKILNSINEMQNIEEAYIVMRDMRGVLRDNECQTFKPYRFYYQEMLRLRKCF